MPPTYNKVQLLDRLDELEEEADRTTNDTIAARNYFNIGLALYNLSYFSYNWSFADEFRSGSSAARAATAREPREVFSHPYAPLGNRESFDMGQALYYFERAMRRAPDRESAATGRLLRRQDRAQPPLRARPARRGATLHLLRAAYEITTAIPTSTTS